MDAGKAVTFVVAFVVALVPSVLASDVMAPAFLWSPRHYGSLPSDARELVNYQIFSPKDLAKTVLSEGGWSDVICSRKNVNLNVDVALIFVGRKLQSSDISKTTYQDPALLDLLKLSFTSSNMSMAFPYVSFSERKGALENLLVSGFIENCVKELGVDHIAYTKSCSINGKDLMKFTELKSLEDFVGSRMEKRGNGQTDLVIFCDEGFQEPDNPKSEGETLSTVLNFLEKFGAAYTVLYASDPYKSFSSLPLLEFDRVLLENSSSNSAFATKCDRVCQFKSSLLEGLFVGIVLLIILISGLCCMLGIDTPTRFEVPQDS